MNPGMDVTNTDGRYMGSTMAPLTQELNRLGFVLNLRIEFGMSVTKPGSYTIHENSFYQS